MKLIPPQQIYDRWMEGYQMKQVAAELGVTSLYVSKVINRIIDAAVEHPYEKVDGHDNVAWHKAYQEYMSLRAQYLDQLLAQRAVNRQLRKNKT